MRRSVVITGASGFVGRQAIIELLSTHADGPGFNKYQTIFAIDKFPNESLMEFLNGSCRVIFLQMDLTDLLIQKESNLSQKQGSLDDFSMTELALTKLFSETACIIHTAAIVDTRENNNTHDQLNKVNVEVTDKLIKLANFCGVTRFVHLSSASACMKRNPDYIVPFWLRYIFSNSMFDKGEMSTYGESKRRSEQIALQFYLNTNTTPITTRVVVLRPHVVWGRGDPLATDIMLQWNHNWYGPQPFIGDSDSQVVSIHVRTLARYIWLADAALTRESDKPWNIAALHGKILNVGEDLHNLKDLHRTILQTNGYGRFASKSQYNENFVDEYKSYMYSLPNWFSTLLIWSVQTIDWLTGFRRRESIFRLLSANNLAYTLKNFLIFDEFKQTFKRDCQLLHDAALNSNNSDVSASSIENGKEMLSVLPYLESCSNDKNKLNSISVNMTELEGMHSFIENLPVKKLHELVGKHPVSQSWYCGPILFPNRIIKAATFESMCDYADGVPTDQLVNYHVAAARGGAGLTIVAYASVSYDGRSFPTQICLAQDLEQKFPRLQSIHRRTVEKLQQLTSKVHEQGGKAGIQITHAGAFNDPSTNLYSQTSNQFQFPRGPSTILNPLTLRYSQSLENDETTLQRIEDDFARATLVCQEAGFDAVELHLGHGYLLSQFLSRRTNPLHAHDRHARLSFPLRILKRVVAIAHNPQDSSHSGHLLRSMAVLVKFNVSELTESDLPFSDCKYFARAFYQAGADLLVPSGGHVMVNGLHMLRGGVPVAEMARAQHNWFKSWLIRWFGHFLIPYEPFNEAFFLQKTLNVCFGAGIPLDRVCLIGGVHSISTILRAVGGQNKQSCKQTAEETVLNSTGYGFAAVQMGRMLLADPNFCVKAGIFGNTSTDTSPLAALPINECDNGNGCIVDATMALKPLRCSKHLSTDW